VHYDEGDMTAEQYAILVAVLNAWFIILTFPNNTRIFSSVDSKGYLESGQRRSRLKFTRSFAWGISITWLIASVLVAFSFFTLVTSFYLLMVSYYFFIYKRYESLSRGLGAPGYFMTWINFTNCSYLLVNEFQDESIEVLSKLFLAEIGVIFLISGLYKLTSGYQRGRGMNVGMCNPQWSYLPSLWKGFTENSFRTTVLNGVAVYGEILGGLFLLSFKFQYIGSFIIAAMFLGVAVTVRLGNLCFLIICSVVCPLFISGANRQDSTLIESQLFEYFLVILFCVSVLAYIGLGVNYYTKLILPGKVQSVLNRHVRFFGTSLWRVFTADITSIYIEILASTKNGGQSLLSKWSSNSCMRFRFVGESITVTSIFTLLKYQEDRDLFERRLFAHAKSLKLIETEIIYRYFYVDTQDKVNALLHVRDFIVDLENLVVTEKVIDVNFDPTAPEKFSKTSFRHKYGLFS